MHRRTTGALAALAAALATTLCSTAGAAPCSDLPNPLYIQSGDTQEPLLRALGRQLRDNTPHPISLVYILAGTCTNAAAIYNGTKIVQNMKYVPSTAEDPAWDPTMPALACDIDPLVGEDIDVAIGATFIDSCNLGAPPAGIGLIQGPVQAYVFVVPELSTQTALTAAEGYFVFGFGAPGMADPWTNEMLMHIRPTTKSTLLTTMAALGVPPGKAKGIPWNSSTEVLNAVANSVDVEPTIGILGVEIYDKHRDTVNALAFEAFDQDAAYFPDKTASSTDKQNVRDGHYTVWAPTVYMTHIDMMGVPTDPEAKYLIDLVLGNKVMPEPDGFDALATVVAQGLVPDCAMKVTRAFEGGDLAHYCPAEPCHCFFESEVGAERADQCVACTTDTNCDGGFCRHGFCEVE